ncbi:hypothetical protein RB614_34030 [Phytohabitans sp. ZYX-F-186]|uniref:Uncharacterized protein n=1 Tax=Phytohabitans maris TaxID=3071409 RepID=A0ABU0ZRB5_9ACTN|nr:hypothetical protein [Phytohabitans sp. ZYX-F-186]MDQ7909551.1 hypothetical protein [Phytohabitans sp. ZYX-F-186]
MTSTETSAEHGTPYQMIRALARRWPTALAAVSALVILGGGDRAAEVTALSETLLFLPLIYLVVARAGRRGRAGPARGGGGGRRLGLRAGDVAVAAGAGALAAVARAWSAVGHAHDPGTLRVQAVGMVGFGGPTSRVGAGPPRVRPAAG